MRFSYAEALCDPAHYLPLARAVEEAGWDSFIVPDSICYPEVSDSKYPYTPDGNREFLENKPFIEPFTLIPAMGAVTARLRFTTFVVKLPIRQPVLVAKAAASVAVMTSGRFGFGVGLSPWPEDFQVTGTDWTTRGKRMDEMIAIIRGLTRGGYFAFHGRHYDVPSIKICPVPAEPIPILVGGHTEPALRRAARLGDGWMHAGGDHDALVGYLKRLADLRREYGREREKFEVHAISLYAYGADGVRMLEDLGVTDVIVGFRDPYNQPDTPLQEKIDYLRRYADDVIASLRAESA
ncbi:MAG TPA: TIGR03619 family F420-dependent LLM class oxidoreductase [Candidatus Eisenbacteria bacterium]|nr:TIGR03619 family F420-dependent LLM class oxidoreductase [Candidatus Eisenbacteria bacterium]